MQGKERGRWKGRTVRSGKEDEGRVEEKVEERSRTDQQQRVGRYDVRENVEK